VNLKYCRWIVNPEWLVIRKQPARKTAKRREEGYVAIIIES